jgi:hypothetical protein
MEEIEKKSLEIQLFLKPIEFDRFKFLIMANSL